MIEIDGQLFRIDDILHVRPANVVVLGESEEQSVIMMRGDVWLTVKASFAAIKEALNE